MFGVMDVLVGKAEKRQFKGHIAADVTNQHSRDQAFRGKKTLGLGERSLSLSHTLHTM